MYRRFCQNNQLVMNHDEVGFIFVGRVTPGPVGFVADDQSNSATRLGVDDLD